MPNVETEMFMTCKGKTKSIPKNFFIFNFIVPLKIQGKRCKTVIMFYFLNWKSKKMNRS